MNLGSFIDYFIHPHRFQNKKMLVRTRLFVRACILTSLFSNSYVWLSVVFEYEKGVYLMIFNVIGFLVLAFLAKTRLSISLLGNLYIFVGAFAVIVLTYFSGGVWSGIYPWIISIPLLAILLVDKWSGAFWGLVSFLTMLWMGILAIQGVELPVEYNAELRTVLYATIVPGLLLITLLIGFVFEANQEKARTDLEKQNAVLQEQKETISAQSQDLKRLIEEKDYIIRILAHDLRNPLKNIVGLIKLMEREQVGAGENKYIAMIMQSTSHAQDLVNRVLEMDASNQDNVQVDFQAVDTTQVIKEAIEGMNTSAKEKSINVIFENNASITIVQADQTYLALILENLLSNALKFSERNTDVIVQASNKEESLIIKVIDNGPGISADEEDKLFKKFSKLSPRPTSGESSTGLGLALVKRYVQLINGRVSYENADGVGATFVVELPI
ncbi:MAG: HAMP domain-containing sensor histidine kinase, partial [Bacteroidota bacterium]